MPGKLFIIAAASGTGKTTLVQSLCESLPDLRFSISCTTRPMRPGERNGVNYYFTDDATFDGMIARGEFLEYEEVFDYRYGTPRAWVDEQLRAGMDIILEIDWKGASNIRAKKPDSIGIFILPPSFAALEQRLRSRAQDNEATIQRRLRESREELSHFREFDYLVINDDLDTALAELRAIIESHRHGLGYSGPDRSGFADLLMTEAGKLL
jgi:guanylate kinase